MRCARHEIEQSDEKTDEAADLYRAGNRHGLKQQSHGHCRRRRDENRPDKDLRHVGDCNRRRLIRDSRRRARRFYPTSTVRISTEFVDLLHLIRKRIRMLHMANSEDAAPLSGRRRG